MVTRRSVRGSEEHPVHLSPLSYDFTCVSQRSHAAVAVAVFFIGLHYQPPDDLRVLCTASVPPSRQRSADDEQYATITEKAVVI